LTGASRTRRKTRPPAFAAQQIELFESLGVDLTKDTYVKYNDIVAKLINDPQKRFTQHWDDEAKVPWLSVQSADGQALFALSMRTRARWPSRLTISRARVWRRDVLGVRRR
jgi:hypothetical protein